VRNDLTIETKILAFGQKVALVNVSQMSAPLNSCRMGEEHAMMADAKAFSGLGGCGIGGSERTDGSKPDAHSHA
jgi:hypothetical protein